jgi:glycosyltransferase involved in cell wall biosynthesis
MDWNGITVLPGWKDGIGNDILGGHYRHTRADYLITLCDAFVLDPQLLKMMNVAHWMPVDCEPMNYRDQITVKEGHGYPIAMSKFGQAEMKKAGFDAGYIPHGIDTTIFAPPENRAEQRARLGITDETFLIGMNAYNKDVIRKGFPEQFMGFAAFHKKCPDSRLLVHSAIADPSAVDLQALAVACGIEKVTMFADQYGYACGMLSPEHLASWYGALDLLTACAFGEGFGIPIIEAQACGTPVVVTDASAMSELCGAGWKVPGTKFWVPAHRGWWRRPDVPRIAKAYEAAYNLAKGKPAARPGHFRAMEDMRTGAREFAMRYDADLVMAEYWKPMLEKLEGKLG